MITWLAIVICLAGSDRCERHQLPLDAGPMACLTAQPAIAAWLEHERPGWRLARVEGCGVGRSA